MNNYLEKDGVLRSAKLGLRNIIQAVTSILPPRGPLVLMFHSVSVNPEFHAIAPMAFKLEMEALKNSGRRIVKLGEVVGPTAEANDLALTFDDGYLDNFEHAAPIMADLGIPASFFIATAFVGGKFPGRRQSEHPMMGWDHMNQMMRTGFFDFYAHGHNHLKLDLQDRETVYNDLRESFRMMSANLGVSPEIFAYPYGRHNAMVRQTAYELGVRRAFVITPGPIVAGSDPLALPRNSVDRYTSLSAFEGIINRGRI